MVIIAIVKGNYQSWNSIHATPSTYPQIFIEFPNKNQYSAFHKCKAST